MRNLTLEWEIVIFTTIKLSKTCFTIIYNNFLKYIVNELEKIQRAFFCIKSTPKLKNQTLCNDYKAGGLKNVDIQIKNIANQRSWIKTLTVILFTNGS